MDISVIVPVYNVEKYLLECLISVERNIKELDAEVIMVDDGSTDSSPEIAAAFSKKNSKFIYYRKENGGLSDARNFGVTKSSGKYIMFVDSDDILVDGILLKMLKAAEKNQTDLTTCNVTRLKDFKILHSNLFEKAFYRVSDHVTRLQKDTNLVFDGIACNKLIRRSYFLDHHFAFPTGYLYEDIPVIFPVYYYANGVSVIEEVGYLWRLRTGNDKSITQVRDDIRYLDNKLEMMGRLMTFVNEKVSEPELKEAVQMKQLSFEFNSFFNSMPDMSLTTNQIFIDRIRNYIISNLDLKLIDKLPYITKQIIEDIMNNDIDHFMKTVEYRRSIYNTLPILENDNGYQIDGSLDIFKCKQGNIKYEFYFVPPHCSIDYIKKDNNCLVINGHINYQRLNMRDQSKCDLNAYLYEDTGDRCVKIDTLYPSEINISSLEESIISKANQKECLYSYEGTAFQIVLNKNILGELLNESNEYYIKLEYKNPIDDGYVTMRISNDLGQRIIKNQFFRHENRIIRFTTDPSGILKIYAQKLESEVISLIVPVHDADEKLDRCLSSIAAQKYFNLEVFLINTDSNGNSIKVCRQFAESDDRFKLINVSPDELINAINFCLDSSTGNYLLFVNSKDLVADTYVQRLYEIAGIENTPLVTCISKNAKKYERSTYSCFDRKYQVYLGLCDYDFLKKESHKDACGAIFKRDSIGDTRFRQEFSWCAGTMFFAEVLKRQSGLFHIDERLYCHIDDTEYNAHGSLSENYYSKVLVWEKVSEIFRDSGQLLSISSETNAVDYGINALKAVVLQENRDKEFIKELIAHIRGKQHIILKSSKNIKDKIKQLCYMTFPRLTLMAYKAKKTKNLQ